MDLALYTLLDCSGPNGSGKDRARFSLSLSLRAIGFLRGTHNPAMEDAAASGGGTFAHPASPPIRRKIRFRSAPLLKAPKLPVRTCCCVHTTVLRKLQSPVLNIPDRIAKGLLEARMQLSHAFHGLALCIIYQLGLGLHNAWRSQHVPQVPPSKALQGAAGDLRKLGAKSAWSAK